MGAPIVYKILTATEWQHAVKSGTYGGSADDVRDGFIHLSAATQLAATLRRHFAGQANLMIVAFDSAGLGELLRWEVSRGGQLFPHLYADLPAAAAIAEATVVQAADGSHLLPISIPGT